MKKIKKISSLLLFSILIGSYFIVPLYLIGIPNKSNEFSLDKISPIIQNLSNDEKFDEELESHLAELHLQDHCKPKGVKIIIRFNEELNKGDRISIVDSILDNYEILANYDIIPAIYLECDANELNAKKYLFNGNSDIVRVSKSKIYQLPAIKSELPKSASLSSSDYPNWWRAAVGATGLAYDGSGIKVAVIDTGIYDHPDLDIDDNFNFVSDESSGNYDDITGHGTHVAGIIGSSGKYKGIAPGVKLINARAGDAGGLLDGDIISAIDWADDRADIISMSFGGGYPDPYDILTEAISEAVGNGVICVVAAGNSGPGYFTGGSPAAGIDAIAVGATDEDNELAYFSSWGPTYTYIGYPDVVAPGVDIISTSAEGSIYDIEARFTGNIFDFSGDKDYIPLSGTSMATPVVSGALAILKQAYPAMSPETARIALLEGAHSLPKSDDNHAFKSGAGLINVSASLDFLSSLGTMNDVAKIYPDTLPIKNYELLNFPGDQQQFNLTIINGWDPAGSRIYDIDLPSVNGVKITTDKPSVSFTDEGVDFVALSLEIEKDAIPGIRNFQINLSSGSIYDTIDVSFEVKIPEYRVLMETYHGLNDLFPEMSFYQMDFYEAMKTMADLNISVDYKGEYWSANYNPDWDNTLLTEELLAQYDLVVLESPILPYTQREMVNLKEFYDNGGNLLFLGTRPQDLCVSNINSLFSYLGLGTSINEKILADESHKGIGIIVHGQDVEDFNLPAIFNNVDKFAWYYGSTFSTSGNAQSIATLGGKTVAVANDGSLSGKGRFVAFGDLYWLGEDYKLSGYSQDHSTLLTNLMDYLLPEDDVSFNLRLSSERTDISQLNISIYAKNQTTNALVDSASLNAGLSVKIENSSFSETILMSSSEDGIALNTSYNLPYTSYMPYTISANLTLGTKTFNQTSKVLYYDSSEVPQITALSASYDNVSRSGGDTITLSSTLDASTYDVDMYMTIYAQSYYNSKQTVSKIISHSNYAVNQYRTVYDPDSDELAGVAVVYILPNDTNTNYFNPQSPRISFEILNKDPSIEESDSYFISGNGEQVYFDETQSDDSSYIYIMEQNDIVQFGVSTSDKEDSTKKIIAFVNFFVCLISADSYIVYMYPSKLKVSELEYDSSSGLHTGSITIPPTMKFPTIAGDKKVSTRTNYTTDSTYIGLLQVSIWDTEGGYADFLILIDIDLESYGINIILIILIIAAIAIVAVVIIVLLDHRRKRRLYGLGNQKQQQHYDYQED